MPHFDHTGPDGRACRAGRMGQHMKLCRGKAGNATQDGMGQQAEAEQGASIAAGQIAGMGAGRGHCHRHGQGQGHNNRNRTCARNSQADGVPQGKGRCMVRAGQTESCGTSQTPGSDGTGNNS